MTKLLLMLILFSANSHASVGGGLMTTGGNTVGALSVDSTKLAADSVDSEKIVDGAVDTNNLATDAVTSGKIISAAVETGKLASDAVSAAKILNGAVGTSKLAADAVASVAILGGAVTNSKLSLGTRSCGAGTAVTELSATDGITCTAFGSGSLGGSGTANKMAQWTAGSTLGDSTLLISGNHLYSTAGNLVVGTSVLTASSRLSAYASQSSTVAVISRGSDFSANNNTLGTDIGLVHLGIGRGEYATGGYNSIGYGFCGTDVPCVYPVIAGAVQDATVRKADFFIATRNSTTDAANPTERLRILSSGEVGIGTSAPSVALHIVGSMKLQSMPTGKALCVNGSGIVGICTDTPTGGACTCQ